MKTYEFRSSQICDYFSIIVKVSWESKSGNWSKRRRSLYKKSLISDTNNNSFSHNVKVVQQLP